MIEKKSIEESLKKIKFIVTDVDGVLTDGGIYISDSGEQTRRFFVRDGLAIVKLQENGLPIGILSAGRTTGAVTTRAKMLDVKYCYVGTEKKIIILEKWVKELKLNWDEVAFLGDDLFDKEVMLKVGLAVCPSDAVQSIKDIAHIVLKTKGGFGCFREFAEYYF